MSRTQRRKQRKKLAAKSPRNWLAVHAHFRRSWVEKSKKKQESKEACKKWKREDYE